MTLPDLISLSKTTEGRAAFPCPGKIFMDSWAGRSSHDVTVIRKTKTRYECRNDGEKAIHIAGRCKTLKPGESVLVPLYAVTLQSKR